MVQSLVSNDGIKSALFILVLDYVSVEDYNKISESLLRSRTSCLTVKAWLIVAVKQNQITIYTSLGLFLIDQ